MGGEGQQPSRTGVKKAGEGSGSLSTRGNGVSKERGKGWVMDVEAQQ